ncbi:hypothetical protein C8F04DRAFT_1187568 [Mycena alexandri]|uniref:Uncharacterized protein n=1 Tax=Mycena alexandri TaxID=1745969 RepID=A0AAD6WW31_9AGAR|nr:hypothetical protein C8F04DRAFT_1187568 [Mycena alexandri]
MVLYPWLISLLAATTMPCSSNARVGRKVKFYYPHRLTYTAAADLLGVSLHDIAVNIDAYEQATTLLLDLQGWTPTPIASESGWGPAPPQDSSSWGTGDGWGANDVAGTTGAWTIPDWDNTAPLQPTVSWAGVDAWGADTGWDVAGTTGAWMSTNSDNTAPRQPTVSWADSGVEAQETSATAVEEGFPAAAPATDAVDCSS